jgi:hypothetical protein
MPLTPPGGGGGAADPFFSTSAQFTATDVNDNQLVNQDVFEYKVIVATGFDEARITLPDDVPAGQRLKVSLDPSNDPAAYLVFSSAMSLMSGPSQTVFGVAQTGKPLLSMVGEQHIVFESNGPVDPWTVVAGRCSLQGDPGGSFERTSAEHYHRAAMDWYEDFEIEPLDDLIDIQTYGGVDTQNAQNIILKGDNGSMLQGTVTLRLDAQNDPGDTVAVTLDTGDILDVDGTAHATVTLTGGVGSYLVLHKPSTEDNDMVAIASKGVTFT